MFSMEKLYEKKVRSSFWQEFIKIFLAANLVAISSHVKVFLPGNPVPFVIQTTLVLFLPFFLGRKAAFAVLLFLVEGLLGLPVFAKGGGLWYLSGATGGYLVGYFVASYILGVVVERKAIRKVFEVLGLLSLGQIIIYGFGVAHLSSFIGWGSAFYLGVLPFFLVDFAKIFLGVFALKRWLFSH